MKVVHQKKSITRGGDEACRWYYAGLKGVLALPTTGRSRFAKYGGVFALPNRGQDYVFTAVLRCVSCHAQMGAGDAGRYPPVLLLDQGFKLVVNDVLSLLDTSLGAVDVLSVLGEPVTSALVKVKVTCLIDNIKASLPYLALILQIYCTCLEGCKADYPSH